MSVDGAVAALREPIAAAAARRPDTFWVVVVVVLFLGFQLYQMHHGSQLADHRIEQCHTVQKQGNTAMAAVAAALDNNSTQFALLKESNEDLQGALDSLAREMSSFRALVAQQQRNRNQLGPQGAESALRAVAL